MFTRVVELTTKPGKNRQLADTIDEKKFQSFWVESPWSCLA